MAFVKKFLDRKIRSKYPDRLIAIMQDCIQDTDELFEDETYLKFLIHFTYNLGYDLSCNNLEYSTISNKGNYYTSELKSYLNNFYKPSTNISRLVVRHFSARLQKSLTGSLAVREFPGTNILCLDIDTHLLNEKQKIDMTSQYKLLFQYLYEELGVYPVFTEVSNRNRGLHIYYNTNVNNKHKQVVAQCISQKLNNRFKDFISGIDIRYGDKKVRLPFAYDYDAWHPENLKKMHEDDAIIYFYSKFSNNENLLEYENLYIENISFFDKAWGVCKSTSTFTRDKPVSKNGMSTPLVSNEKSSLKITKGNRVGGDKTLISLCFASIKNNLTKEEFFYQAWTNNESSVDLTDWLGSSEYNPTEKGIKELGKLYDWCSNKYDPSKSKAPPALKIKEGKIKAKQKKFIKEYRKKLTYKKAKIYVPILKEIFLRINYEEINPRKVNKDILLTKKLKKDLTLGYQFPRKFQNYVKNKYNIKGNIYELFNTLLYDSSLFSQIFSTKRGYLYGAIGSCRQFNLNTDIFNYLCEDNIDTSLFTVRYNPYNIQNEKNILLCVRAFEDFFVINNSS